MTEAEKIIKIANKYKPGDQNVLICIDEFQIVGCRFDSGKNSDQFKPFKPKLNFDLDLVLLQKYMRMFKLNHFDRTRAKDTCLFANPNDRFNRYNCLTKTVFKTPGWMKECMSPLPEETIEFYCKHSKR